MVKYKEFVLAKIGWYVQSIAVQPSMIAFVCFDESGDRVRHCHVGTGGIYRVLRFLQLGTPGSGLGMNGL